MVQEWFFPSKDELKPSPTLPNPFLRQDGSLVLSPEEWPAQREYLKAMLMHYMYGRIPPPPKNTSGETVFSRKVYGGKAIAETVRISFGPPGGEVSMLAEIVRPAVDRKVPVITWNQFRSMRGCPEEDTLLKRGYAIAEFDKEQLAPDNGNFLQGPLVSAYPDYDWGALAVWSWGHSRLIDYLEQTDWADTSKIVATGASRGGKVAFCAGIFDERITLCAPVCSGFAGAGSMRFLGTRMGPGVGAVDTAGRVADMFPHWWNDEFGKYGLRQHKFSRKDLDGSIDISVIRAEYLPDTLGKRGDELLLPFDQHFLRALIAPRALLTLDSLGDSWANPYGVNITWRASEEVYRFLGRYGVNAMVFRDGPHGFMPREWLDLADFCDMIFFDGPENRCVIRSGSKAPEGGHYEKTALREPPLLFCDWSRPGQ